LKERDAEVERLLGEAEGLKHLQEALQSETKDLAEDSRSQSARDRIEAESRSLTSELTSTDGRRLAEKESALAETESELAKLRNLLSEREATERRLTTENSSLAAEMRELVAQNQDLIAAVNNNNSSNSSGTATTAEASGGRANHDRSLSRRGSCARCLPRCRSTKSRLEERMMCQYRSGSGQQKPSSTARRRHTRRESAGLPSVRPFVPTTAPQPTRRIRFCRVIDAAAAALRLRLQVVVMERAVLGRRRSSGDQPPKPPTRGAQQRASRRALSPVGPSRQFPGTRQHLRVFLTWCRSDQRLDDVLLFETSGLVERREERNLVLTLLQLARSLSEPRLTGAQINEKSTACRHRLRTSGAVAAATPTMIELSAASTSSEASNDEFGAVHLPAAATSGSGHRPLATSATEASESAPTPKKKSDARQPTDSSKNGNAGGNGLKSAAQKVKPTSATRKSTTSTSTAADRQGEAVFAAAAAAAQILEAKFSRLLSSSFRESLRDRVVLGSNGSSEDLQSSLIKRLTSDGRQSSNLSQQQDSSNNGSQQQQPQQQKPKLLVFRNTKMVRVGGGWVTLEDYLKYHEPDRLALVTE
uniref:GAR domain-containing protein n=1 Tax=Macrostomum lignano TaxID=282301 RepID=A0A1I8FI78_9PLAT